MWLPFPSLAERMLTLNLGNGSPYQNDNSQKQQRPQLQISFHLYGYIWHFCLIVFTTIDIFHSYYGIAPPVKTLYVKDSSHTAWNNDAVRIVGKQHLYSLASFFRCCALVSNTVLRALTSADDIWEIASNASKGVPSLDLSHLLRGSPFIWPFIQEILVTTLRY